VVRRARVLNDDQDQKDGMPPGPDAVVMARAAAGTLVSDRAQEAFSAVSRRAASMRPLNQIAAGLETKRAH